MPLLGHSPSHKYVFPRLYRERMYGGLQKRFELPLGGEFIPNGCALLHENHMMCGEALISGTAMTVNSTAWGKTVRSNGEATWLEYDQDIANPSSYYSAFNVQKVNSGWSIVIRGNMHTVAGTNQYFCYSGVAGVSGFNIRRHSSGNYLGLFSKAATETGTQILYSPTSAVISDEWRTWAFSVNVAGGAYAAYKDAIYGVGGNTINDYTLDQDAFAPKSFATAEDTEIARMIIYTKPLTHAEVAMISADLM